MQTRLISSFADDGNASWYSVCRMPIVEWRLDCENCHHFRVVGLHDTGLSTGTGHFLTENLWVQLSPTSCRSGVRQIAHTTPWSTKNKTKQNKQTHKKHTTWTVTCLFLFLFLLGSDAFCQRRTLRGKAKSRQGCVYTSTKFLPIGKKRSSFSSVRFLQRT